MVLADTMPGAVGEKVGPTERDWFAPSIDLTVHLLDHCRSAWVLAHNRARFAGDGYASADMALWDCGEDGTERPRLVAYATQLFLFSFLLNRASVLGAAPGPSMTTRQRVTSTSTTTGGRPAPSVAVRSMRRT